MSAASLVDLPAAADMPGSSVGGKARQLGRMALLGLPVPEGFVVPATTLADAFAGASCDAAQPPEIPPDQAAALRAELDRRGWSTRPLAVRSSAPQEDSATASYAGIYRSELNVVGAGELAMAVGRVWASLWAPQAVAYRRRIGASEYDAAMAVVVMPMVPAVAAGVAFTCDPHSGRDDRIVIDAVHGLGEALVSGLESGEEIVVEEDRLTERLALVSRRSTRQNVVVEPLAGGGTARRQPAAAPAQVLGDARALELAHLLRDAAQAIDYADPCYDFEWVWDGDRFHLVQARPVTRRPWHTYAGLAGQEAIWSNGNTRDVVPLVMGAMDWIGWRRMVDLMLEQGYRLSGFPLLQGARRSALFNGRLYLNASFIQWEGYDALGVEPKAMNAMLGGHHPQITVPKATWKDRLRRGGRILRYLARAGALRRQGRDEAMQCFSEAAAWRRDDRAAWSEEQLQQALDTRLLSARTRNGMLFLQGSSGGNLYLLLDLVERALPGEGHGLVAAVMAGGEPSISMRQGYDLQELAQLATRDPRTANWLRRGGPWDLRELPDDSPFRQAFADLVERYGHRGIYESYLRSPRFREDPAYLLDAVAGLLDSDPQAHVRQRESAERLAWQRLSAALPVLKRWWARRLVNIAREESNDRELARSAFTARSEGIRLLLLEGGERLCRRGMLDRRDEVFDLTPHELIAALGGRLSGSAVRHRIAHRRRQMAEWESRPASEVIVGGRALNHVEAAPPKATGKIWSGVPVGCGIATGAARIVRTPLEGTRLRPGDILVAPSTDPAWTPLFLRAGGLAMETGGFLSHGAIIAREFGIPAVVNLPGILASVEDGCRLRVDGERGEVAVVD